MKPKSLIFIATFALLAYGCKKNNSNPQPNDNIQISLVSGNNQTVAVGHFLPTSVVVKVTNNGKPVKGYVVQFIGSGCNSDFAYNDSTKVDGTATINWSMATDIGAQTLRAIAINGKTRVDSISVTAIATNPTGGPLLSACATPYSASSITKLSTGRLLASFYGVTSIRYSDDQGFSWHALTSFGANHQVLLLAVSQNDEILAATRTDGVFYSKDAGSTWKNISPPNFNKQDYIDGLTFTNSGNIIFCGSSPNFFISGDKGTTWTSMQSGLPYDNGTAYGNPVQLNNGDLYVLSFTNVLYKSTDGGKTWTQLPNDPGVHLTGICTDSNGLFYKTWQEPISVPNSNYTCVVAVSIDNGTSFRNVYDGPVVGGGYYDQLEVLNGSLFFETLGSGIFQVQNLTTTGRLATNTMVYAPYTLNQQGQLVYSSPGYGIQY